MTAIETIYKGVKFRSRLEARHAFMFDELGIKWEYEPEGFTMPDGQRYLPDFYLPEVYLRSAKEKGTFFEVKPSYEKAEEKKEIFSQFDKPLVVSCGTPDLNPWSNGWLYEWWKDNWDNYMFFKYCYECKIYEIEYCENNYCICRKCGKDAEELIKWGEIAAKMKSIRF